MLRGQRFQLLAPTRIVRIRLDSGAVALCGFVKAALPLHGDPEILVRVVAATVLEVLGRRTPKGVGIMRLQSVVHRG